MCQINTHIKFKFIILLEQNLKLALTSNYLFYLDCIS